MRHRATLPGLLILPLFALAACGATGDPANFANRSGQPGIGEVTEFVQSEGYRNYERPDGTFDRADYRRINTAGCLRGIGNEVPDTTPQARQNFCTCMVDRLLQASDDQLRAIRSDRAYGRRAHRIVMTACAPVLDGQPPDPMVAPEDEAGSRQ